MPPSLTIRSTRIKDSIENRRARGEISCAECRRHKLRCDKAIPCSTCVRKGCESICPNGTLAPVHGMRPKESNTSPNANGARIANLTKRIRELEDALQIAHSAISAETHPLLAGELLLIKSGSVPSTVAKSESDSDDAELVNSFGTLAITGRGTESYLGGPGQEFFAGHLGSPESLLVQEAFSTPPSPGNISYLSKAFPFTPLGLPTDEIQAHIEERLPTYARASALVEAYLENLSWFFRPLDREQIVEELLPAVYKRKQRTSPSAECTPPPVDPHALSLLLAVFAAGAAADLTLSPWNDESELYYHLARTALSLKPVFEGAGLHAVQAIALIGAFNLFSCRKNDFEGTWKMMSFSLSLAASIGLNRDPAHFKLSPKLVQRRRRVFWELYTIDFWKSICTGRPMTFTPPVVDCEFPGDTDANVVGDGAQQGDSIWLVRYRFMKEIMMEVITKLAPIRSVKYSEILALDQKIREYGSHAAANSANYGHGSDQFDTSLRSRVRETQMGLLIDITLLLLHRSFFTRALVEVAEDPVRTRFGPSFLCVYRSSTSLVHNVRKESQHNAHLLLRCWPVWGHTVHATVVLGCIAASASVLAPQAYIHFSAALDLFSKMQIHPLVKCAVPILTRFREQILQALEKHGNKVPAQLPAITPESMKETQHIDTSVSQGGFAKGNTKGELSAIPSPSGTWTDGLPTSETNSTLGSSVAVQESASFFPGPYPRERESSEVIGFVPGYSIAASGAPLEQSEAGYPQRYSPTQKTNFDVEPASPGATGQSGPVEHAAHQSPQQQQQQSIPAADQLEGPDAVSFQMETDQVPTLQQERGTGNPLYDPQFFDFSSNSSLNPDVLSTYTTFDDLINDRTQGPGSNFETADQGQSQSQSASVAQPQQSFADPLTYGTPSRLSPGMFFNSDFDVSYDMRASVGEDNILSLLPEDMEVWRTILQDSRFFGLLHETPGSGTGTPKTT